MLGVKGNLSEAVKLIFFADHFLGIWQIEVEENNFLQ